MRAALSLEALCINVHLTSRRVIEIAKSWRSLKAVRYIEGSGEMSEAYSIQWSHGDGLFGDRFMNTSLDNLSIALGCSKSACGIDCSRDTMSSLGDPEGFTSSGSKAVRGRSGYMQSAFDLKQLEQGSPRLHFSLRCLQ